MAKTAASARIREQGNALSPQALRRGGLGKPPGDPLLELGVCGDDAPVFFLQAKQRSVCAAALHGLLHEHVRGIPMEEVDAPRSASSTLRRLARSRKIRGGARVRKRGALRHGPHCPDPVNSSVYLCRGSVGASGAVLDTQPAASGPLRRTRAPRSGTVAPLGAKHSLAYLRRVQMLQIEEGLVMKSRRAASGAHRLGGSARKIRRPTTRAGCTRPS